jgi:hypothetical protein
VATAIATTTDGGYMVVGRTYRNPNSDGNFGNNDVLIAKLDAGGNLLWQYKVEGLGTEEAKAIVKSGDGGFLVAGYTVSEDYSQSNILLLKLDPEGTLEWQKTLPSSTVDEVDDIIRSADGGYVLTGYTNTIKDTEYGYDALVLKIAAAGNTKWRKTLGGSADDWGHALLQRSDGSYVMAAQTESNDGNIKGSHGKAEAWVTTITDE